MPTSLSTLLRQAARFRRSPIRLRSLPRLLYKRGVRRLRQASSTDTRLGDALSAAGIGFEDFRRRSWSRDRPFVRLGDQALGELRRRDPARVERTISTADRLLRHEFRLLGSGPFVPRDPERSPGPGGYRPIDWYLDPVSGLRFPRGVPYQQWDLYAMRPGTADIKLPWELARCQHWPTLGQAYALTRDPRYALEIARQLDDFDQANPLGIGIHWTCTMDVALRALNWALGLALVRDCEELSAAFWRRAYGSLFDHGRFIMNNLENTYEVTSNHYLSNIVGLYHLGKTFRLLPEGRRWDSFSFDSLHQEIQLQTLDDGADFESSIPYHRLVTELFLSAARLGEVSGTPFSASFRERLRRMVRYLAAVLRPDGLLPQLGDADDGRAHILTDYGDWNPQDGRHLFAPAALHLDDREWLHIAADGGLWEAAWWGFDVSRLATPQEQPAELCELFPDAGVAVVRSGSSLLLVTNSIVGTKGFGNHKHNDQLSFEYHLDGRPILVDPGSYVYTSDPEARNLFRSTAYHNTVTVDGEEQNETNPEWLFRMFETAKPEHLEFREHGQHVEYRGRHVGYRRLRNGLEHQRRFRLDRSTGVLLVVDVLSGSGSHHLKWHFHCAPGVEVRRRGADGLELRAEGRELTLLLPPGVQAAVSEAWYSPSYGVRQSCAAVDAEVETTVAERAAWLFAVGPSAALARLDRPSLEALRSEMLAEERVSP